jgi:predicted metal-dependent peptidase
MWNVAFDFGATEMVQALIFHLIFHLIYSHALEPGD